MVRSNRNQLRNESEPVMNVFNKIQEKPNIIDSSRIEKQNTVQKRYNLSKLSLNRLILQSRF